MLRAVLLHGRLAWWTVASAIILAWVATGLAARPVHATDYHVDGNAQEGVVAYFKFDEGSGTVTRSFPNTTVVTASLQSGASFTGAALPPGFTQPNFATVLLDGSNDFVNINDQPGFALTDNFTIAAWIRRDRTSVAYDAIYDSGTQANTWWVFIAGATSGGTNDNRLGFGIRNVQEFYGNTSIPFNDGIWRHVAVVKQGSTVTFYVNGNPDGTRTSTDLANLGTPSGVKHIGGLSSPGTTNLVPTLAPYKGRIDEFRLYNRALSQAEIQRLAAIGCARDGLSWPNAFFDLQCALAVDQSGDTVKVTRNIFRPGINRDASFNLAAGVHYLGNFNNDNSRVSFSPEGVLQGFAQMTTLDGDLLGNDVFGSGPTVDDDNARHVVTAGYSGGGTLLDRFVVQAGNADGAQTLGGGLRVVDTADLAVQDALFQRNKAEPPIPDDVTGDGGAIHTLGDLDLTNVWFDNNQARLSGGAIYVDSTGSLTMDGGRMRNNRALLGAGLRVITGSGAIALTDVDFEDNDASIGGGIRAERNLTIQGGRFVSNSANFEHGGAIRMNGALVITATEFLSNSAAVDGGAIYLDNGGSLTMTGGRMYNNEATQGGGVRSVSATLNLNGVEFVLNDAANSGGAVSAFGTLAVNASSFLSNTAVGDGGGISVCCGAQASFANVVLQDNLAENGGGLHLSGGPLAALNAITMTGNTASGIGGGLYLDGGADAVVTGGVWNKNSSEFQGGGVYVSTGAGVTITNGLFLANQSAEGGGLHVARSSQGAAVANSRFEANTAVAGGAINAELAAVALTNVDIVRNTAGDGQGGVSLLPGSRLTMNRVNFIENITTAEDGGGLAVIGSQASGDRVLFQGNRADATGGALYVISGSAVTLTNALLVGNSVIGSAGINDVGNAIRLQDSTVRLINPTLAGHDHLGRTWVQQEANATLTLVNGILWDNGPTPVDNDASTNIVLQTTIEGNPGNGTDPRFVRNPNPGDGNWSTLGDNDYGDLRLKPDSPAIDAGDGSQLPPGGALDLPGNPRIFDANYRPNVFASPVDLGAFEARFSAPTANPGGPYTNVVEGQPTTLNGAGSVDAAAIAAITTFQWDCTNDGAFDATGATAACTYSDNGTFTLRLRVTDGDGLSNEATTTATVGNAPPSAANDQATTPQNTPITVNVLANDSDVPADPLTLTAAGAPNHGAAAITADQRILYTPAAGFVGNDGFTYTVDDGDGGSASATVQITVTGSAPPPPAPGPQRTLLPLIVR
jgi:predicted outer membrane repeat protein